MPCVVAVVADDGGVDDERGERGVLGVAGAVAAAFGVDAGATGTLMRSGDMRGLCGDDTAAAPSVDVVALGDVVEPLRGRGDAGAGTVGRRSPLFVEFSSLLSTSLSSTLSACATPTKFTRSLVRLRCVSQKRNEATNEKMHSLSQTGTKAVFFLKKKT